jgi:hypothetical protein
MKWACQETSVFQCLLEKDSQKKRYKINLSVHRQMNEEMWYKYTMEYYSTRKKTWNPTICGNTDKHRGLTK